MRNFLARNWFLVALSVVLPAGLFGSEALRPIQERLSSDGIVAVVLFFMSLSLDSRQMGRAITRPVGLLLAIGVNYGLAPLAAWGMSPLVGLVSREFADGLLIAASVPTTVASAAVWTRRAGGNDTIPLLATMITNAACFLVTPFWLVLMTGVRTKVDAGKMVMLLALTCVLPMALGQLARLWPRVSSLADSRRALLGLFSQCGILFLILIGAIKAGSDLASHAAAERPGGSAWMVMLLSVALLHGALLGAAHLLGWGIGLSRPDRIGAAFSGSQKTLAVGLSISGMHFGALAMLPMIAYHATQLLIDTLVAERLRRAAPTEAVGATPGHSPVESDDSSGPASPTGASAAAGGSRGTSPDS